MDGDRCVGILRELLPLTAFVVREEAESPFAIDELEQHEADGRVSGCVCRRECHTCDVEVLERLGAFALGSEQFDGMDIGSALHRLIMAPRRRTTRHTR